MLWESLSALFQVVAIDVALAGDNAVVVGMAAAGLPSIMRRRAILIGIAAAAVLRIIFATFTMQLLQIVGLLLAGGLLLLWVAWKLWRELSGAAEAGRAAAEEEAQAVAENGEPKTFSQAVSQIVIADVSMSLDNVLAVAGASRAHEWVLVVGLTLSVALMGLAANVVAKLLGRFHWIAYGGLLIILYVAIRMIWDGAHEVMVYASVPALTP